MCVTLAPFSSLWPAVTLTVHINGLHNESVHRQEQHTSGINTIPYKIATLMSLESLKLENFMKLCSLLYVRCRHHRSAKARMQAPSRCVDD